ncbi:MAG: geranylgeranylglyceryl/heptaprenylglyceryl phosphate synthase [Flavobacteriaceae bacterium]|nr:geranylgeranylglyceryl/heptaprenylglyceryl phosphate synthase [Flavobacteriaceae bacterium]
MSSILNYIQNAQKKRQKLLAILLDPDKTSLEKLPEVVQKINESKTHFIFVGGSLLFKNVLDEFVQIIKKNTQLPVILFPGNAIQISHYADGILFLSLISGRNPEFLIGNQVIAAPLLKESNVEILATGYLLIESGRETTASYISNTKPIPHHKPEIAMATALAGEMLGHQLIYLDGGSGAQNVVPSAMIKMVADNITIPLIVGGGIKSEKKLYEAYENGADLVVIGTAFENDINFLNNIFL